MADHVDSSTLINPPAMADPSEIDLEAGPTDQIQCRIGLETDDLVVVSFNFPEYTWSMEETEAALDELVELLRASEVIASLAYLVYLIGSYQQSWLRLSWRFDSALSFYYISEEYERRINNSRETSAAAEGGGRGGGGDHLEISFAASNFVQKLSGKVVKKMELVNWSLEPKTQIGLAASDGFFSA
ncbi:hypothetical protein HS088_TW13G00770 [Tripterygium wilfordii]|uniref:Uncharacterized protein n=1 Tax=Tripterygium wilfordii TaxID=458696 RepID=A0A7J7CV88_TRIWF|nr:hypothetical protein HS088_TW13G00770 [Tripterygium wilfordii]